MVMKYFLEINWAEEKGTSLATTVVVTLLLTTLGVATLSLIITDTRITASHLQSTRAFWLAQAGVELTSQWLHDQNPPPAGKDAFTLYPKRPLGYGVFTTIIDPDDSNVNNYLKRYSILSTGTVGNISRTIRLEVRMSTFGKYAYLSDDEGYGNIWFVTGDVIEGPLHSNDRIAIMGRPTFLGKVTSTKDSFKKGPKYNPEFKKGYQLGVPRIALPTFKQLMDNYWKVNTSPPKLVIDAEGDRQASIEFKVNGTIVYNVWHWRGKGKKRRKVYDVRNATEKLSDLNGIILVKGDVQLWGTVNGEVTVVATDDIWIMDDIRYLASDSNGRPTNDCNDLLGLISMKNVIVADTEPNINDVIIDAAIFALGNSFTVENYNQGEPRGHLRVWGSISQKVRGAVGTRSWRKHTGYYKDYHYDDRFLNKVPPYYPPTGEYDTYAWREVS